jgi:hypothetical protein
VSKQRSSTTYQDYIYIYIYIYSLYIHQYISQSHCLTVTVSQFHLFSFRFDPARFVLSFSLHTQTYIALHCITLHYITLPLRCVASRRVALRCVDALHYITLHYITLHYITMTLHYITLCHYVITLHCIHLSLNYYWQLIIIIFNLSLILISLYNSITSLSSIST